MVVDVIQTYDFRFTAKLLCEPPMVLYLNSNSWPQLCIITGFMGRVGKHDLRCAIYANASN